MSDDAPRRSSRSITPLSPPAVDLGSTLRFPIKPDALTALVRAALDEDQAQQDITSIATITKEARTRAVTTGPLARSSRMVALLIMRLSLLRFSKYPMSISLKNTTGSILSCPSLP